MNEVRKEVALWMDDRHKNGYVIKGQFTTEEARIKLKRLYPTIDRDKVKETEWYGAFILWHSMDDDTQYINHLTIPTRESTVNNFVLDVQWLLLSMTYSDHSYCRVVS